MTGNKVLVLNCGSSSIKFNLYDMLHAELLAKGLMERIGEGKSRLSYYVGNATDPVFESEDPVNDHHDGLETILHLMIKGVDGVEPVISDVNEILGVGHRVVHGGEKYHESVVIDPDVIAAIEECVELAPLHNPPNLEGIQAAMDALPGVKQVAAFDTAYHQTLPQHAYMYAIPQELYERYGIRRYGFHGTSHEFVAERAAKIMHRDKLQVNLITAHLGNGCSTTAIRDGYPVDTSMGLTPLEGLVMGTRSGDIDPAIIYYLVDRQGWSLEEVNKTLQKKSGLLGLSGTSNDVRILIERAGQGDERARLALDVFCYRLKKNIGAYRAVLGLTDAVVFTGGIGEKAYTIREKTLENLGDMGIVLDPKANKNTVGREGIISSEGSTVKVYVIPTNEELAIAEKTYKLASSTKQLNNSS